MVLVLLLICCCCCVADRDASMRKKDGKFSDKLLRLMQDLFGLHNVTWCLEESEKIEIIVDSGRALLDPVTLAVETGDDGLLHLVSAAARRLHMSLETRLTGN